MKDEGHGIFEDPDAGYLVSVSDIMAGLLFIFIITLVSFVIQFQFASEVKEKETEELQQKNETTEQVITRLTNNRSVRDMLLQEIKDKLLVQGVRVSVDQELGVLRLTEETVRFRSMSADLDEVPKRHLTLIAAVLNELLPCYALNEKVATSCDPLTQGKLEAVFIEGHTDNKPIRNSSGYTNWDLSAKRAIATYQYVVEQYPNLGELQNASGLPLFSVAGYAEQRPVVYHDTPTDDERNRRIDIRFIMTPPSRDDIELVEEMHRKGIN